MITMLQNRICRQNGFNNDLVDFTPHFIHIDVFHFKPLVQSRYFPIFERFHSEDGKRQSIVQKKLTFCYRFRRLLRTFDYVYSRHN